MKHSQYLAHLARHSDVREHLGLLRGLALECDVVVELGFRTGVSTSAFLAAERPKVISYDTMPSGRHGQELSQEYGERFSLVKGDSREVSIPECDLLFIDTDHTEETTRAELRLHSSKVKRWIVLHDTKTFGRTDRKPGKGKGILAAVDWFLGQCPGWLEHLQLNNNNGLTLLKRRW